MSRLRKNSAIGCFLFIFGLSLSYAQPAAAQESKLETDVVVIGFGGAGVSASVSAAEAGLKVIALEKQAFAGGSTNFAEGLFGVGTDQTRRDSVHITPEQAYRTSMEFNQFYRVNPALVRTYLKEAGPTIRWLEKQGVNFRLGQMSKHEPRVWHVVEDYGNSHHGAALIKRMVERANELGVQVMYKTQGKKLIYQDGAVKGVEAEDANGNKLTILAKAVILATGGFPDSKEKVAAWTPFDPEKVAPFVSLNKTGEGIDMARAVGADTVGFGLTLHPGIKGKGIPVVGDLQGMTFEPNLWVNKYGDRFADETIVESFVLAGNAIESQRDSFVWSVFDENTVKFVAEQGARIGMGVIVPVMKKLTNLQKEIDDAIKAGNANVVKANTLNELAKKMGVDAKRLQASVAQFNQIREKNVDEAFTRDPATVIPVNAPPYYALQVRPYYFTTTGGIRITPAAEATDANDNVIKGLYATGSDAGGQYGRTYTLWASGSTFSFAVTTGRLAGVHAAQYIATLK
ncbi:FAD-dependent oxidoreductase [Brenneria corticis]|uniref:FAD-binding dehydrogenase n=1 Tax=Brenneria corticis TaxID=2173106 RepID=A0A2U1U7T6_9GAMM|nr:FAD-dependent oxidoreductase [Brenneria sp. CFCC 11842]PWC17702.1 FAD-binding dehydrogenase [Brenneria sp. CFCC 11842]